MFWILRRLMLILALIVGFALGRTYERLVGPPACDEAGAVACSAD